jgi:hypothetical protein
METRAHATASRATLLLAFVLVAACRSTADPAPAVDAAPAVLLDSPSLEGVDPAFLPDLRQVQSLMAEGNFLGARAALDRVLARRPEGRTLEVARRFSDVLDLDPGALPALQALKVSVDRGADVEARAILDRLMLRRPRGKLLDLLEAYRRILDGRAVVSGVALRLELRPATEAPSKKVAASMPKDARLFHLFLVGESRKGISAELEPGPATLVVTRSSVDRRGLEEDAVETHTFSDLKALRIEPSKPAEVSLAGFFLAPPDKGLAERLRFEIDLRSGRAKIGGAAKNARELPAMHLVAVAAEETALDPSLAALPATKPEEFAAHIEGKAAIDRVAALSIALRIPPADRAQALDLITPIADSAPVGVLDALAPSLRWIAVTSEPGGDGLAWRAWLRARGERKPSERPRLVLPEPKPGEP